MKRILVHGMGCLETGSAEVLHAFIAARPADAFVWVLCPFGLRSRLRRSRIVGSPLYVVALSHTFFGRWLRIPLEFFVALALRVGLVDAVINLSNYGLCPGGSYVLYQHSPLILDHSASSGWSKGKPNFVKRWLLGTCLRRAALICVQSEAMLQNLQGYCGAIGCDMPAAKILRPRHEVPLPVSPRREFAFQLFYPASRFPHKRTDLAIEAAGELNRRFPDVGLVITADPSLSCPGVHCIGLIPREQVGEYLAGSEVMLFTSERETLGLPLLEALALGVPVVAPRLPYAIDILGAAGCYFETFEQAAIVQAVEYARENLAQLKAAVARRAKEVEAQSISWQEHWREMGI